MRFGCQTDARERDSLANGSELFRLTDGVLIRRTDLPRRINRMSRPSLKPWELELEAPIKQQFECIRSELSQEFTGFAQSPPKHVKCIGFEIRSRFKGFPVSAYALDSDGINEVNPNPGRPWSGRLVSSFEENLLDPTLVDEHDISYELMAIFLAEFIGDCWQGTVGSTYGIPVFANHQDRPIRYDCIEGRWYEPSW